MKKKIFISFIMALLAIMVISTPILAADATAEVTVSDISIDSVVDPLLPSWVVVGNGDGGNYYIGTVLNVSGTVTITATADPNNPTGSYNAYGEARSNAQATVTNPDGTVVVIDSNTEYEHDSSHPETATASQTFVWSATLVLNAEGEYVITQSGEAYAEWAYTHCSPSWAWWTAHTHSGEDSDAGSSSLSVNADRIPDKPIPWMSSGGFTAYMNDQFVYYKTVGYTMPISKTLSADLSADFGGVKIFIPAGTIVNKDGVLASCLGFKFIDGKLSFITQFMSFSNPVMITLPDGSTFAFKNIVNGVAEEYTVVEVINELVK